jgi:sigma-E factor negative regulatory protein RseC
MIETAKIVKVEKSSIIVKMENSSSCSSCAISGSCSLSSNSKTMIPKPKGVEFQIGDYVEFQMPEHLGATKLSVLLYGIPLIIFIGGTISLLDLTKIGNFLSLGLSLGGAGIYYWLLSRYSKKHSEKFSPYVVRKINPPMNVDLKTMGGDMK